MNHQLVVLEHARNSLGETLAAHVLHAVMNDGKLVIYTDASIWATQLRFQSPVIRKAIEHAFHIPIKSVRIKITRLPNNQVLNSQRQVNIPSQSMINKIREQGLLIRDPVLKNAFLRLGNTLQKLRRNEIPS